MQIILGNCSPFSKIGREDPLEYQRQLNHRQGHDNAQTLFGVEPIPCDNQIRTLLDPIAPRYVHPVFFEVFTHLEQQPLLDPFRVLAHQL